MFSRLLTMVVGLWMLIIVIYSLNVLIRLDINASQGRRIQAVLDILCIVAAVYLLVHGGFAWR